MPFSPKDLRLFAPVGILAALTLAGCATHGSSVPGHFRVWNSADRITSLQPADSFYEGLDAPSEPDMDFTAIYAANDSEYLYLLIETREPLRDGKERWLSILFDATRDSDPAHAMVTGVTHRPASQPWNGAGKSPWYHGYDVDYCIFYKDKKTEANFLRFKDGSGADWKSAGKTWKSLWMPRIGEDFYLDMNARTRWEVRVPRKDLESEAGNGEIGILITYEGDAPDFVHEDFWPNDASDEKTSYRYKFR